MAATPTYPNDVVGITQTIVPANTIDWVTLYDNSAGSKAVRVESLNLCSDDTSTVNIQFALEVSAVPYLLGTVQAVTLSGTNGTALLVNALAVVGNVSPDAIRIIYVPAGAKLVARSLVTVTAARTVSMTGWARTYA